mgnify:CR=1 FL=1
MCTVYDSCVHVLLPRATRYPTTVITTAAVPGSTSDPVVRDRHAGGGNYEVGEGDILSTPIICGGDEVSGVTSDYWPPAERWYWASPPAIAVSPPPLPPPPLPPQPSPLPPFPSYPLLSLAFTSPHIFLPPLLVHLSMGVRM